MNSKALTLEPKTEPGGEAQETVLRDEHDASPSVEARGLYALVEAANGNRAEVIEEVRELIRVPPRYEAWLQIEAKRGGWSGQLRRTLNFRRRGALEFERLVQESVLFPLDPPEETDKIIPHSDVHHEHIEAQQEPAALGE